MRRVQRIPGVLIMMITWLAPAFGNATTPPTAISNKPQMVATMMKAPLSFEANKGQTDPQVSYLARGQGYTLFLTPSEAVLALRPTTTHSSRKHSAAMPTRMDSEEGTVLRLQLLGATPASSLEGLDELSGKANYFLGSDPKAWYANVPLFTKVMQPEVYPGIGIVYYGNQRQLEFDFIVAPGADPGLIRLNIQGADRLEIDASGNLLLRTSQGSLQLQRPLVYQELDGEKKEIPGRYVVNHGNEVRFQMAAYDTTEPLIIDPTLVYSTYIGGAGHDEAWSLAVDSAGNAYVTGWTDSINFPTTAGTVQPTFGGGTQDAFVTKLNPTGSTLVYSSYLGGSDYDYGYGIAVDGSGSAYVAGLTVSSNFPATPGSFQPTGAGSYGAFVAKLDAAGSTLVYSTYLGGSGGSFASAIAVDPAGNAYITGAAGPNFPTTAGAFQIALNGSGNAIVTVLNPTGSGLVYSTYLGGGNDNVGWAIALDGAGNAYVTGRTNSIDFPTTSGAFQTTPAGNDDAFVTAVNPGGSGLVYSTFLGGTNVDEALGIAVDSAGSASVTGITFSSNFPVSAGAFQTVFGGGPGGGNADSYVTTLDSSGSLAYSTYLGGNNYDLGHGIAKDSAGNVYVTGGTQSTDFPITAGSLQPTYAGIADAFLVKLNPTGTALSYSTYLGGSNNEEAGMGIAINASGNVYLSGYTWSVNFPTTAGAFQVTKGSPSLQDVFVAQINPVAVQETETNFVLHGTGPNANPPTVLLNDTAPTATVPKYRDSAGVKFAGGNLWKDIGTWATILPSASNGNLTTFSPLNVWVGLKNSDDQGTQFDLRAEIYKNATLVAAGETRCITGVTRNENLAKAVALAFPPFSSVSINGTSDVVSLKLSTRIGTNPDNTKCSGPGGSHNNAVGLRVYFDAVSRAAAFVGTFEP